MKKSAEGNFGKKGKGMLLGFAAVACFAFTLPATRIVVRHSDPLFAGVGRIAGAGAAAALLLGIFRPRLPDRRELAQVAVVAFGVVIGFPLLSSLAMSGTDAVHGSVLVGVLPLATALCGALIFGDRPSPLFWVSSAAGGGLVGAFAVSHGTHFGISAADLALLGAVACAAIGYAVGGNLTRTLGGWQVICWALVLCLPLTLVPALKMGIRYAGVMPPAGWWALAYLIFVSQLVAFFAWNRGMALGGIARVSQLQLLQPFITIGASALFFGEKADASAVLFAIMVIVTVAVGKRAGFRKEG